ncbi:wings apart-like protein 2 [Diospyros lotus]|uniref:wings apart-like protein 2 n=1 Tax=Diospyros lotus TaxID=55363 RepID=UPI00224EFAF7|nr:wings apart-like protein 2 [Diospyros lotus]
MIVRTYGRRNRSLARGHSSSGGCDDVASDVFGDSLSEEAPQDIYSFGFSSQDSSHWSFDSEPYGPSSSQDRRELPFLPPRKHDFGGDFEDGDGAYRKPKKGRNGKGGLDVSKKVKSKGGKSVSVSVTATLMETQEFGEMMEHVDEVNFALDGLRKGQPVRIRRASLLSLLSICGAAQQRRLLRSHGMAKTIIDAVLGLTFEDSPSNLAAAALFYVLTSEGQDDHVLDSSSSIRFLIKLLKPLTSNINKEKASTISSKLLAFRKDDVVQDMNKGIDSTSAAIMTKVQEILVNFKDMKSGDITEDAPRRPELTPKWIALLTMEKACLSTISLEDTSGTVRKTGGNFKEKLRELGGLDAVFGVIRSCHSVVEKWLQQSSFLIQESKEGVNLESLVLLLKCLKIMENATFLSKDNQDHLLQMKGSFDHQGTPRSFTKVIISVIKILSGLSLSKSSSGNLEDEKFCHVSNGTDHASDLPSSTGHTVDRDGIISISSSVRCQSTEGTSSLKSFSISQNSQWLSAASRSAISKSTSENSSAAASDTCLLKMRVNSSASSSSSGVPRNSCSGTPGNGNVSTLNSGLGKMLRVVEEPNIEFLEDSQDPFAFHEDEFEPSKWDLLSGRKRISRHRGARYEEHEDGYQSKSILSQEESSNLGNQHSDAPCSSSLDEEKSNLLSDCLLTAVKVLMNLTNDNPVGCQQIAACGGLETLSSLIAGHFPSFNSSSPPISQTRLDSSPSKSSLEVDHQNENHLSDQELDFLVSILGLLVNLVEKDSDNRSRLAAANVSLPSLEGLEEGRIQDVIPLLCSIFLANQGAVDATGEGKVLSWDDEAALLQGEKEAEKMIIEAYAALLLAFLSTESKTIRGAIAQCLPDHSLAILVPVLERFVEFHLTLNMISPETHKTVLEVIESCRMA